MTLEFVDYQNVDNIELIRSQIVRINRSNRLKRGEMWGKMMF